MQKMDTTLQTTEEVIVFPASYQQERLWHLHKADPENFAFNIPHAIHFEGPLDIDRLRSALDLMVERHEALRTNFIEEDGEILQVVSEPTRCPMPCVDLSRVPKQDVAAEIQRYVDASQYKFNLERDRLWRTTLLRVSDVEHVLVWSIDVINFDGWSINVIMRELGSIYQALLEKSELPAEPELQFGDWAEWQREAVEAESYHSQRAFWHEQLRGVNALIDLPSDHPRPDKQTYPGDTVEWIISAEFENTIAEYSRKQALTPFMVYFTAFQLVLYQITKQTDILVGVPVANRSHQAVEGLIGHLSNVMAMRTLFDGDPTIDDLLQQVRTMSLDAFDNQDYPFELLVKEVEYEVSGSRPPLFQVMFFFQNFPPEAFEYGPITISDLDVDYITSRYDFTLMLWHGPDGLRALYEYNTDLFTRETMQYLLRLYETALTRIVSHGHYHLSKVSHLMESVS